MSEELEFPKAEIEKVIGDYFVESGAEVDKQVMLFGMQECRPLSAAILRGRIEKLLGLLKSGEQPR